MDDLLNWLRGRVPGFLRPVVEWLLDIARAVYARITYFLALLGAPFGWLLVRLRAARAGILGMATEIYHTLWWLKNNWTWFVADYVWRKVVGWVTGFVIDVRQFLLSTILTLRRWAEQAVNWLATSLRQLRDWATGMISQVWNTLTWVARRVGDLLLHPERMVAWILGPLIRRLQSYAWERAEAIGVWLIRSSPAFTRHLASVATQVIARIL